MKKRIFIILISLIILGGIGACIGYKSLLTSNVKTDTPQYIEIYTGQGYESVMENIELTGAIQNMSSLKLAAKLLGYKDKIKEGRYELTNGLSSLRLIQRLKSGRQTPVRFTFNNIRTKEQFAERVDDVLMMTKDEFLNELNSQETLNKYGLTKETNIAIFIPNTYEFYWNISPKEFIEKMNKEYEKFWTPERLAKLSDCNLTRIEVSTLASIVEEETIKNDERPKVAGLYLNRLRIGMMLQADPTVKFAIGDFSIKRVTGAGLVDSPYNTYKYAGLPPGPIRIPCAGGIDAVLNYEHHDYLFMCAKRDFSGYHDFSKTFGEHQNNAHKYHKELDKKGIK